MKKVVKFGGSSLASAEQFRKVAEIILSDKDRRYVVPSAPGKRFGNDRKVTDMLYECQRLSSEKKDYSDTFAKIKDRYQQIINELALDFSLEKDFETIDKALADGTTPEYVASRGEYLNGKVLAAFLGFTFVDSAEVIRFDGDKELNTEVTNAMLKERLCRLEKAVVPGFYGAFADGRVQTFSRGGSDITGSLVARAVNADVYENWTDVSGCMIADPRIVKDPEPIEILTYRELRELAYMGASVLHDEAIFPVRRAGIPINIRNTNDPQAPGTLIVENTAKKPKYTITGIAGKKGFCAVNIEKDRMNNEVGFGRKVLTAFEDNGISFEHLPSGIDTMSVFVHTPEFIDKEQSVLTSIRNSVNPDYMDVDTDLALIAVVGRGMRSAHGTAGRIFSALAHQHINIRMIDQGSSELNIIIGVNNEDFDKAIAAIYDLFVLTKL